MTSPLADSPTPTVSVSGTAAASASVGIYDNGTLVDGVTADSAGNWSDQLTLVQGPHELTAAQWDSAGDESPQSAQVLFTVDSNQLLTNGNFASPSDAANGGQIFYPTVPGWQPQSQIYPGNDSCGVELGNHNNAAYGSVPPDATGDAQWAELASNCVDGVAQDVPTVAGGQYILSFQFMARPTDPSPATQDTMSVEWNGSYLAGSSQTGSGLTGGAAWQTYQYPITATGSSTTLEFDDTNPVATDSVGDFLANVTLVPLAAVNTNTDWETAQDLTPNGSGGTANQPIDFNAESLWYRIPVQPGQQVQVSLSNLPADYEIGLYSDIGAAYQAETTTTPNLAQAAAQQTGTDDSRSQFASTDFAKSQFARSQFASTDFARSQFARSQFARSQFARSQFAAAYSDALYNSLQAVSTTPGAVDKSVVADTWNNTGYYYIQITGNNGAFAPFQNFAVTVTSSAGLCNIDGNPITLQNFSGDSNSVDTPSGSYQTVIVDNSQAMPAVNSAPLAGDLSSLATDTGGVMLDVSQSTRVQALTQQAQTYPQCPYALDLEAEAIQQIINSYRAPASTTPSYVVIVGDDDVIPFFRYPDQAGLAPESDYQPPVSSTSAADAALQTPDYLSDDQYGAQTVLTIQGAPVPLPTAAVGRLVETPTDIDNTIQSYLAKYIANGNQTPYLSPGSSLTTGYDFMQPPAQTIATGLATDIPAGTNKTLLSPGANPNWTASDLTTALSGNQHYDVAFLGSHFSANNLLAADDTTTITTNQFASFIGNNLNGSLVLSAGCHAGYGIDPADAVPGLTDTLAWPQAFSEAGATLIAGTGYQYGDSNYTAYSDQLYVDIAQQLDVAPATDGPAVAVGTAMLDAEQQYLSGVDQLNGIQAKALLQTTLYGLPMLGILMPHQTATPGKSSSVIDPSQVTGETTDPGLTLGLSTANYDLPTNLPAQPTPVMPDGSTTYGYYQGAQGVEADPGGPVLPVMTEDVNASQGTLRGVGFMGGSYTDTTAQYPLLTGDPVTDASDNSIAPFSSSVFQPETMWNPNYFSTLLNGGDTDLSFTPVQYRSSPGGGNPEERKYSDVNVQLYYSHNTSTYGANTPANASPPAISDVTSTVSGDMVNVSAHVTGDPAAGMQDAWVTFTGSAPGTPLWGKWQSVDLTQDGTDSTLWTGSYADNGNMLTSSNPAADSVFIVQAVNGVGEVTLDDNQANYFTPTVTPGLLTSPTVSPDSLTWVTPAPSTSLTAPVGSKPTVETRLTAAGGQPIVGRLVTLSLGASSVIATTDGSGDATAKLPVTVAPSANPYPLTVSFGGDSQYAPNSAASTATVNPAPTSLVLSAPPAISLGTESNIKATLTSNGTPLSQKTVYFVLSNGSQVVGGSSAITNASGVADAGVLTVPTRQSGGGFTVTAYFGGAIPLISGSTYTESDPYYASFSPPPSATVAVNPSTANIGLLTPGPVVTGQKSIFTASVTPPSSAYAQPTGTVSFSETPSGGTAVAIGSCTNLALSSAGQATCTTSFSAKGSPYAITAAYSGDSSYSPRSSASQPETVTTAATQTTPPAPGGSAVTGQPVTFTSAVTVTGAGSGTPTGNVIFYDGPTVICTEVLPQTTQNQVSCPTAFTTAGPHTITAKYVSDGNFAGSSSPPYTETVGAASTTTSLKGPSSSSYGSPVTVTATVAPSGGGAGVPTRSVFFYVNGVLAATSTLGLSSGNDVATASLSGLQPGSNSITATYQGDTNFMSSTTTAALSVSVTATKTISGISSGSLVVGAGQSVLVTGTVKGSVSVSPGGSLAVEGGTIGGSLAASGAGSITLCAATIQGSVSVSGSKGFVQIGGSGCARDTIAGPVSLSANTGGTEIALSTVNGSLAVTNNTGYLPTQYGPSVPTEISGNTILGALACSGNSPPPTDGGQGQHVYQPIGVSARPRPS